MTNIHQLIFKGDHGNTREIASIQDFDRDEAKKSDQEIMQEAMLHIRAFCAAHNFKIYYTRIWNAEGKTIFDVGSHTEFFHLIPEVQFEQYNE